MKTMAVIRTDRSGRKKSGRVFRRIEHALLPLTQQAYRSLFTWTERRHSRNGPVVGPPRNGILGSRQTSSTKLELALILDGHSR